MRHPLLLCSLLAAACAEPAVVGLRPGSGGTGHPACRQAAVALRDHVPDYQKQLTEQFTVPHLEQGYDRYWYFTASATESQHAPFVEALTLAGAHCRAVDVFLLAHGNRYIDWVAEVPEASRRRLRLVYDTGGGDAEQGERWLALGAHAYVGHPGPNIAPLFYVHFLPAWLAGKPLEEVVRESNRAVEDGLFGATSTTVLDLVRKVGFPIQDPHALWEGTRAELFGDPLTRASQHP